MELNGTIQPKGSLYGSFDFDQANYNLLKNKPSINGVTLIGNKTSEDLHINSEGGGGGGTTNYNDLENKPKINDVILQDELSLHSLGIQAEINFSGEPTEYLNGEGVFTTPPYWLPVNFDTAEQDTGVKWIDGKKIYVKVMYSNTQVQLTDTQWTIIPWVNDTNDIDTLISAIITNNVPNNSNNIRFSVINGEIRGASTKTGNFPPTQQPLYIIFYYTKQ